MRSRSAPAGEVTLGAKARALARSPRPPAAAVTVVQRARVGAEVHRQQAPENDEEDDNGTVQGLVGAGVGAALVPRLAVEPHDESVVAIDLGSKVPPRLVAIAWHRDRYHPAAARAFVETAREVCEELEAAPALAVA